MENHSFLEPYHVIIDDVPESITIDQARESYKDIAYGVIVHKLKRRGQETQPYCHIVYDFKSSKNQAENFVENLKKFGYKIPL